MTTAWYRPTWDLALDPLVSCKLCLGEYPVEQMTTLAQCRCVFCTLVGARASVGRRGLRPGLQTTPVLGHMCVCVYSREAGRGERGEREKHPR